jgi:plasmid stabilization system protein ParE
MRIAVHPAALQELDAALAWSREAFGPATAARLLGSFEHVGALLIRQPSIGTRTASDARWVRLGGFPYSLVDRTRADVITIVAVAHQSRKPGYWAAR